MQPRPYQLDAISECALALRDHRSALVAMPTGTGKTVTFAEVIRRAVAKGRRVLVLAHREELLDQAADKIERLVECEIAIEQGARKQAGATTPVVIASVLSMIRRLERFAPDSFDLVIVDEAHRALSRTYRETLDHFDAAKVLGFTATPNRGDEKALAQVFETVAYDMPLDDAIRGGWLTPIKTRTIQCPSLDLSKVRKRQGELAAGELGSVMSEVAVLREAIVPAVEIAGGMQAIVFCVTLAHMQCVAQTIAQVARERCMELPVATVDGTTPKGERREVMRRFRGGLCGDGVVTSCSMGPALVTGGPAHVAFEFGVVEVLGAEGCCVFGEDRCGPGASCGPRVRWLLNVGVATEGFDAPATEAVIFLRPTMSRALWMQMGGRATRPLPGVVDGPETSAARRAAIAASAKPHCLWLDFTDNSDRHDLASPIDLLGGDYSLPERKEAQRLLDRGEADSLLEALEMVRRKHEDRITEARARSGDPFALFNLPESKDRWGRSMTAKQKGALDPLKIPRVMDLREANAVLTELARREDEDLALYSQVALLAALRHPIEPLEAMPRIVASKLVRVLADRFWFVEPSWAGIYSIAGEPWPGS